ncbi:IPT/TIG domain-containing protein [Actinoplanes sp. CA-015351]|uniref:IPT/TIG domain-containing protein n=1 Tax=Actinoplanes sp. CA-015351 TaxID=3239897 RepID=UPI003D99DD49
MNNLLRGTVAVAATSTLLAVAGGSVSAAVASTVPAVSAVSPAKISTVGGATVTITGKNFTGVDSVSFGTTAATSFSVVSATKITAVAPAGTNGAAPISITAGADESVASTRSRVTYRSPLDVSGSLTAKASGGPLVLTVTGGALGSTAKEFGSEVVSVLLNNKTKLSATWVDASRMKVTVPSTAAESAQLTVVHDTIAGTPATIALAPVVTGLTVKSSPLAGGVTTTVKVAGANPAGATDFTFGGQDAECTRQGSTTNPQFVCVVPPADEPGPVVVAFTSAAGTPSRFTASAAFAYTQN